MTGTLPAAAPLSRDKILNPANLAALDDLVPDQPLLVLLAAGKGTRFGSDPKCIQLVHGTPLARHSIDEFHRSNDAPSDPPAVVIVGYKHAEVSTALGADNVYVLSANPAGGTAFAAWEAFSVPALLEKDPLLIVSMGDRIVPASIYRRLCETHRNGGAEAAVTFLSAVYEPPKNRGKGRVLRDRDGRVIRILEERDALLEPDPVHRQRLLDLTEGNCPLYVIRASTLYRLLRGVTNDNAQSQFYLTDVVQALAAQGKDVRTVTTTVADPEYDLLCSDVTQPMDLALLEGILSSSRGLLFPDEMEVEHAARAICDGRPPAQVAAIARQLSELASAAVREKLGFHPSRPLAIGVSGGRLRIAFMHPDMARFFGPAWQMPIGAGSPSGDEQIVVITQGASDGRIHLFPVNPKYRESINSVPSDFEPMYPGDDISGVHAYEGFGTRMSESLLLSLGYFSDEEVARRKEAGLPLPPPSLWVGNSMRRPFALVGNAIASMRTLRTGSIGARIQDHLGRESFRGLRLVSSGAIPEGGFSSSSALTVATKNAINALYGLGISADLLVHLACQAEYGTGVRAGSLDQATEQKGRTGEGTLISSNPRENYRILGTFPVPAGRIAILFPYSVERDRNAWRWSGGVYSETIAGEAGGTTGEMRKMTGKAAEIAALLTRLPVDTDFFKAVEDDLLEDGLLSPANRRATAGLLARLPLRVSRERLRELALGNAEWYAAQLNEPSAAASAAIETLFAGWRDPVLRRALPDGKTVAERGVPLRAMVAYLFAEVAKNFFLIHHPERWIEMVALSQLGDTCYRIDPERLPTREDMEGEFAWDAGVEGPTRLSAWLDRAGAQPYDFNRGLDDAALSAAEPPEFHQLEGGNFFRGLALIDLAGAMLTRAFGRAAVAIRVNAAGQGDFFQVHVDRSLADPDEVKRFLQAAFYRRFGLAPSPAFVEPHSGGGACGVRLSRYSALPQLIRRLQRESPSQIFTGSASGASSS
ncbi:MAG: NTP transferase domain-containing protein [Bryobacteraceae bacterium]